jgi:hypothetical protein
MKIIETKVFKFEELDEAAQETAISELYDINVDYEWWDYVYTDAEDVGLKIKGFDLDRGSYCNVEWIEDPLTVANKIIENHGPDCETHKDAEIFLADYDKIMNDAEKDEEGEMLFELDIEEEIEELEDEFLKTMCENYRIMLSKEYEYLTSEEAIKETIIINEYDFLENGKLF